MTNLSKLVLFFSLIGFLIYFAYGIRHSVEGHPKEEEEYDDEDSSSEKSDTPVKIKNPVEDSNENASESARFISDERTSEC